MTKPPLVDVTNVNEKIYNYIKQNIISSNFPSGSRLNVKELGAALGVSSTPIKDALFRLSGEGLVEISSRSGTYVRSINQRDIHEILQVRMFLEKEAVEVLAEKITDSQLQLLESIFKESLSLQVDHQDPESYRIFMECDSRFHRSIVSFIGNKFLIKAYKNLNAHMQTVRFLMLNSVQGRLPTTDSDHKMILEALSERNVEKSKNAIENHIRNADNAWNRIGKEDGRK